MKTLLKLAGSSGLLCLLFAMPVEAQIVNGLSFTTTFPFYAGNTKLPPGTYTVTPSSFGESMLQIENTGRTHSAFIEFLPTQSEAAHASGDVTFKKYGTVDFLDRLWVGGQQFGMQLEPTKVEKKLAESGPPQTHSVPGKAK
jgi:hypothetical protein